jgi:diaminopimelate epimerase
MEFVKVHGTGNDFVLLPDLGDRLTLDEELVRRLCDRHLGLGGDGVIRLAPARDGETADVFMDYRNADGSVAEMCGNGVRCVAKFVVDRGLVVADVVRVDTRAGVKAVEVVGRHGDGTVASVRVDMGAPLAIAKDVVDGEELVTVSMGNPHAVLLVDDPFVAPVHDLGPRIERAFPEGANVEFVAVPSRDRVVGRIWERGVGETMASGSGCSAMAVAANVLGLADRRVTVVVPGGELEIDWTDETLFVTGPAAEVAEGRLSDAWLTTT